MLAEDDPIPISDLTYEFQLKKGIKWADPQGKSKTPIGFSSNDVKFSVDLITEKRTELFDPMLKDYLGEVRTRGEYAVSINLQQTFYDPHTLMSFKVLPQQAPPHSRYPSYRTSDKGRVKYLSREPGRQPPKFTQHPIGTGPFMYKGKRGNRHFFEKNPYYGQREGKTPDHPYIDQIEMTAYQDATTMIEDLQDGEIDLVLEVGPGFVTLLRQVFELKPYNPHTVYFLAYNMQDDPNQTDNSKREVLRQPEFRKAVTHAVNRHAAVNRYFEGKGQPHKVITGPFPVNTWAYNHSIEEYEYNLDLAKEMIGKVLAKLGYQWNYEYKNAPGKLYWQKGNKPLELTFMYISKDQATHDACDYIRSVLADLGLSIRNFRNLQEPRFYRELHETHNFDIVYHSYSLGDTLNILPWFGSKERSDLHRIDIEKQEIREPLDSNLCGMVFPDIEEAIKDVSRTMEPDKMRAKAHYVHKLIHDRCIYSFLWQLDQYAAYKKNIEIASIHPYYFFSRVEDWKITDRPETDEEE